MLAAPGSLVACALGCRPMSFQFATRTKGLRSSAIRDLLKVTEMPNMLSLAGGLPTPDSFPLPDLRREADRLLGEYGPRVVQYSATDGVVELRRWIAEHYSAELGRAVAVDGEIVVTHGSQQALDLLAKVLVDPGDVVVSESPAYLGAVQALELFEPRFEVIPGDEHGMQVELLADRLAAGLRPKLVYVVPNFHNPSGATMSLERRRLLAALADQYELLVVEDDPYGAIRFAGIAAAARGVVHHAGRAPQHVLEDRRARVPGRLDDRPARGDGHGGPSQAGRRSAHGDVPAAVARQHRAARPGWLDAQKARIVPMYRDRCNALADALDATLGDRIRFHRPEGGMFLWTEFDGRRRHQACSSLTRSKQGVAFVPGNAFTIDQRARLEGPAVVLHARPRATRRSRALASAAPSTPSTLHVDAAPGRSVDRVNTSDAVRSSPAGGRRRHRRHGRPGGRHRSAAQRQRHRRRERGPGPHGRRCWPTAAWTSTTGSSTCRRSPRTPTSPAWRSSAREAWGLVGRLPGTGDGATLMLNGHIDVVPIGDPDAWTDHPFVGARCATAVLYGRGACDMKAGLVAAHWAVQAIRDCRRAPARRPAARLGAGRGGRRPGHVRPPAARLARRRVRHPRADRPSTSSPPTPARSRSACASAGRPPTPPAAPRA